jgi:hypothetical protein
MGTGCVEVTRTVSETGDIVLGRWADGRLGTVRVLPAARSYGAVAFRPDAIEASPPDAKHSYLPLLRERVGFFRTGRPPAPNDETLEIFAFMDAAQRAPCWVRMARAKAWHRPREVEGLTLKTCGSSGRYPEPPPW